jgi:mono/diheme cytochrome c family protein/glucose/arabinose dehydrogenase
MLLCVTLAGLMGCETSPSPPLAPEEERKSFALEPDLTIQLVASEPLVQDPVVIAFDEDNRMWVVEMRGFMPDIEGNGEQARVGRISILEDNDGDGVMDRSTIYMDSLVLPRALAIVKGGALVAENQALWLTEDTNHDLKADKKTLIDPDYAGNALPEHAGNGLLRATDNWYYNAKSKFRYRLNNGQWQRDTTEFRGQWGISQDDEGRLYYNYNWSQLHADLVPPNYMGRNPNHTPTTGIDHGLTSDRRVYPARPTPAVNRGYIPGTLNEQGKLVEFTAACSPFYYRGSALPQAYYGNVFVCEPSGNLIKRNVLTKDGIRVAAHDPHPGVEFLASTDERFRPVFIASAPDGALYVADMYRGLIQHGAYVTPYLRDQTLARQLEKPVNYGRIWRIVPKDWKHKELQKLSSKKTEDRIDLLLDKNGWHRDIAQRLLVEAADTSVRIPLEKMARSGENVLARYHALYVLEGLQILDPNMLMTLLDDREELIRIHSLRLLEPFAQTKSSIAEQMMVKMQDIAGKSETEILQLAFTARVLPEDRRLALLANITERYDTSAFIRDAVISSLHDQELTFLQKLDNLTTWKTSTPSHEIFLELLTTCIVKNGDPSELTTLLRRLNVGRSGIGWKERTILTALSIQGHHQGSSPVKLSAKPEIFANGSGAFDSTRLAAIATLFEWPGHAAPAVDSTAQAAPLIDRRQFALGRQHYLTSCAGCHGSDGNGVKRFAPPLAGSEWVTGDEKKLALIILHGLEGPVAVHGKVYDAPDILPAMPSLATMDDHAMMAIMNYIRNEWGNRAAPITENLVGKTRHTTQGKIQPWTADELNKLE